MNEDTGREPGVRSGGVDPRQLAALTADFFGQAATDTRLGERLALAQTTVHIHYGDEAGCTLLLDRTPIGTEPRIVGEAEVELWGSPADFLAMVRGEKQLAMAIANGEVEYRGPVRKFLRIMPILRSLDFSPWREVAGTGAPAAG